MPKLMPMPVNRRSFLQRFVLGSASSVVAGKLWSGQVLGSVLEGPDGVLTVKVSDYPALLAVGGSIQLSFWDLFYPVIINRGPGNVFYAMDSDCQHLNCVVQPYNHQDGFILCPCHGSTYAIDGSLVGGPALRGLNPFPTSYDGVDTVKVTIPGLHFSISQIAVHAVTGPATRRLRLQTDIFPYARFRVCFQRELADAPQTVSFATTPEGPADSTAGYSTSSPVTIYVDATTERGFYTVVLIAQPYQ